MTYVYLTTIIIIITAAVTLVDTVISHAYHHSHPYYHGTLAIVRLEEDGQRGPVLFEHGHLAANLFHGSLVAEVGFRLLLQLLLNSWQSLKRLFVNVTKFQGSLKGQDSEK